MSKKERPLLAQAREIKDAFYDLGDKIDEFRKKGGKTDLTVYQDDGEALHLHDLTGEFVTYFFQVERLEP